MTDSIRISLDLTKMSTQARMVVDGTVTQDFNPKGRVKRTYDKASTQKSPMSDAKTYWRVRTEQIGNQVVPYKVEANLNIPNAVAGQNVLHGTSVFASAVSALYFLKIWMAESGVPGNELDKLTLTDVRLLGVTLSYPQHCVDRADASELVRAIGDLGRILYGDKCVVLSSSNETVYLERRDYMLTIYNKTNLAHCAFKESTPVSSLQAVSPTIVRTEVKLESRYLQENGLTSVERWRNAYAERRYEQLFNELVRRTLRLDDRLRYKAPRPEVFSRLSALEAHILRGYLRGLDPRAAKTVLTSSRPAARFHELRKSLMHKSQVDIDIPWSLHRKLRSAELGERLSYSGDFDSAPKDVDWVFSQSSWDGLRGTMYELYEQALAKALLRTKTLTSADW
ncbi:hypothetical protein ABIB42_003762 [Massilia sp. UYP32]|uniref:hypothetical protein n=1 Tax=Massilia sp. UYP32 TaxID=1756386 RepID=UPI003D1CBC9F